MRAQGLLHPLLPQGVGNDARLDNNALVTGSNATGKSTFLKAVALAALLSQSLWTCTATRYEAPYFHIATSMAVRDNLLGEESYFVVEVLALKRLLDYAGDAPALFVIDEILRGTNTRERIAASSEVLRFLCGRVCLCIAATHDIELTYLLADVYENLHFTESVTDEGMVFDYRLRQGRSQSCNALRLMQHYGYPAEVVSRAMAMADPCLEPSPKAWYDGGNDVQP